MGARLKNDLSQKKTLLPKGIGIYAGKTATVQDGSSLPYCRLLSICFVSIAKQTTDTTHTHKKKTTPRGPCRHTGTSWYLLLLDGTTMRKNSVRKWKQQLKSCINMHFHENWRLKNCHLSLPDSCIFKKLLFSFYPWLGNHKSVWQCIGASSQQLLTCWNFK
jgi:hypothetical protein